VIESASSREISRKVVRLAKSLRIVVQVIDASKLDLGLRNSAQIAQSLIGITLHGACFALLFAAQMVQ
jgi:hypothetical protein